MAKKIKEMSVEELQEKDFELRQQLQDIRIKGIAGNNTQEHKQLRKERARVLTALQGRTQEEQL